jgi:hypothetical protein
MRHWMSHRPSRPPFAAEGWSAVRTESLCPVCGTPDHPEGTLPSGHPGESHGAPGLRVYVSRPMSPDTR